MNHADSPNGLAPKSSWKRKLAVLALVGGLLLVAGYFVVTSSAFLQKVILPRVSRSVNAEITVGGASIRPFSGITLQQLRVRTTSPEPLLEAETVRLRYSLLSILRGKIAVSEVTLEKPVVHVVEEADGKTNLDAFKSSTTPPPADASSASPLQLLVRNVALRSGTVRQIRRSVGGGSATVEVSGIDVTLDQLANGLPGKLTFSSLLAQRNSPPAGAAAAPDAFEGKASGTFQFTLDPTLLPKELTGNARVELVKGEGAYAALGQLGVDVQAKVTPTEVQELAVRFQRNAQPAGQLLVAGPFDTSKGEAQLKLTLDGIDRNVLNWAGAGSGIDFGASTLSGTSEVRIGREWNSLGASGTLNGRDIAMKQGATETPRINLSLQYQAEAELRDQTALVRALNLTVTRKDQPLLSGTLDRPMNLTWAPRERGFAESNFRIKLEQLDLVEWRPLLGTNFTAGTVNLNAVITAKRDAKELTVKFDSIVRQLSGQIGETKVTAADFRLDADALIEEFRAANLRAFSFAVEQQSRPTFSGKGSGRYDARSGDGVLELATEATLPDLTRQFALPSLTVSSGRVQWSTSLSQRASRQTASGNFVLSGLTGQAGAYRFTNYNASVDYSADLREQEVQIHRTAVSVQQGTQPGGSVELSGQFHLGTQASQIKFKISDLNQAALQPILGASMGEKQLVSLSIHGSGQADYQPAGESTLRSSFNVTNWVVFDPRRRESTPPLGLDLTLNGSSKGHVIDLRDCLLQLTKTDRAINELQLKAHLDFTPTNATASQISLSADSLDLTHYYTLIGGSTNAAPPPPPAPVASGPPTEPEPAQLPVAQLTADLKINQLYLRELAVSQMIAQAKIDRGLLTLDPLQLSINGAPVSGRAALNLGVRGYTYDVSFQADRVPLAPLANSFSPDLAGHMQGNLDSTVQVKGAGVTGTSLRQNLAGQVSVNLTNLNLDIVGRKTRGVVEPIAQLLRIPEVVQSPLTWVAAETKLGQGQITIARLNALSSAFASESQGSIPIADVLTNSPINLPVSFALRRSLAERANLVPPNAPTNTPYVALPEFVRLSGTLGNPQPQTDKKVILGLLARSASQFLPGAGTGGKVGGVLEGVGQLLNQRGPAPTNAVATNTPPAAAPASAAGQLIQGIGSLLGGQKRAPASTNPPAAAPKTPNR